MTELIIVCFLLSTVGLSIYITKFKDKGIPKVGTKKEKFSDYYKDYSSLKLYWTSIGFMIVGISTLITILIFEIFN